VRRGALFCDGLVRMLMGWASGRRLSQGRKLLTVEANLAAENMGSASTVEIRPKGFHSSCPLGMNMYFPPQTSVVTCCLRDAICNRGWISAVRKCCQF